MKMIAVVLFAAALAGSSMAAQGLIPRQDTTSTGTQTSTSATSSVTPQISFGNIHSMTACNPAKLVWAYVGPDGLEMSLVITNQGVDQSPSPPSDTTGSPNTGTDLVQRSIPGHLSGGGSSSSGPGDGDLVETLTDTVDPSSFGFVWSIVNVPQGWYMFQANIAGTVTPSAAFFVANGTDMSCLTSTSTSTTSTSSPPTSSSSSPTSPMSSPPSESSGNTLPVGGSSSGSHVNKGAIAGGVIGGLVVLAAIVAAVLLLRYSSSLSSHRANGGILGKWGNLGSFDSGPKSSPAKAKKAKAKMYNGTGVGLTGLAMGVADPQTRKPQSSRHNSEADSIGPINIYNDSRRTPAGSQDDIYSPYEEKYARSPFGDDGVEEMGMIPIGYAPTPSPAGATASHGTKHSSMASSTYSYAQNNYSRPRSQSAHNKLAPSPQTFPESPSPHNMSSVTLESSNRRASSPTIPSSHLSTSSDLIQGYVPPSPAYPSGSSGTAFNSPNRPIPSPIPPVDGGSGATSSTPVTPTARKTPRKPVPTYNPQDPELSYQAPRTADVPTDVRDSDMPGTGDVPYLHELHHKGSFKQMHYLIPDMPPPQRD